MNISAIRVGLAARLATISGLKASPNFPDEVIEPHAIVGSPVGTFDIDMTGNNLFTFPVFVYVARAGGDPRAQEAIDAYLSDGASSIKAAVDGDRTLGGTCDYARVLGWQDYGGQYTVGANDYVGVQINVEVMG